MKRLNILILMLISAFPIMLANHVQSNIEKADSAYLNDEFIKALSLYQDIEKNHGVSSELYYNIGNCQYRMKNIGKAILYYERALNLDPSNDDARNNLELVKAKANISTNVDEANIIVKMFNDAGNIMTSDGWAICAIIIFIIFIIAIGAYIFTTSVIIKKIGFFGGIILLVFDIIANYYAFSLKNKVEQHQYAIITTPSAVLSTSPRIPKDKTEEAFILNEGTKVMIIDSIDNNYGGKVSKWYDVKANDSHRAWINKENIDII